MTAALLHLDDAFARQASFAGRLEGDGAVDLDMSDLGPALRLWARPKAMEALRFRLNRQLEGRQGRLVFMGSGDFHHVSHLLIERAVAQAPERPLTIIHFDNHPDWVRFSPGLHCGSWAARVARLSGVKQVLTIGLCSDDVYDDGSKGADLSVVREGLLTPFPLRAGAKEERVIAGRPVPSIEALGDALFLERLSQMTGADDIYITIDKDVLAPQDAATNWDQGELRLNRLLVWLEAIADGRRVRGADVTGDGSRPVYGPHPVAAAIKWVEARLDQPAWKDANAEAHALNASTNIALYNCLSPLIEGRAA